MKRPILKLAAALLRGAGEEFGNHSCNDFNLSPYLDHDQQVEFVTLMNMLNGSPEDIEDDIKRLPWTSDFAAMYACANIMEKLND